MTSSRTSLYSLSVLAFVFVNRLFCSASTQNVPLAQLDLKTKFVGQNVKVLGFGERGTLLFTRWNGHQNSTGYITCWNISRVKKNAEIPFSKWLSDIDLTLSSDGKWLSTINVRSSLSFPDVKSYRVTLLNSSNLKTAAKRNVPKNEDVVGFVSLATDPQHVIAETLTAIPIGNDVTFGRDRLDWINANTGKTDRSMPYKPARECDRLIASDDSRYFLGLFYADPFDSHGESSYGPYVNKLERGGFVDVIDPKTGKIVWHIAATKKMPVGDPLFFISPTRFISSDTVFNIATKTARPWNAITPTRKCLAAVSGHSNYSLFLTPSGLQLRDWQKDKLLVSWPSIKQPGRIMFSPDLKMFSFKRGSLIQFWRFDPKWLD